MIYLHILDRRETATPTDFLVTNGEIRPIHEVNHFIWHMLSEGGEDGGRAPRTISHYAHAVCDCYRYFECIGVSPLQASSVHLIEYYKDMEDNPDRENTASTVNQKVTIIGGFYRFLAKKRYIIQAPSTERIYKAKSRGMKAGTTQRTVRKSGNKRREPSRAGKKILTRKELNQFISRFKNPRDKCMARLMWATGLRVDEAVNFTTKEEHLPRDLAGFVRNDESFDATIIGKGNKARMVEIPSDILREILQYKETLRPATNSEKLFVSSKGKALRTSAIQAAFRRNSAKTGIKIVPHDTRHGFGIERLIFWDRIYADEERRNGKLREVDEAEIVGGIRYRAVKQVMLEMGHSSISTTEGYLKYLDRYKQAAHHGHKKFMQQLLEEEDSNG